MISPQKKYKELSRIDNIKKLAYDNLFTKYIIENRKGDEKKWELDSTNQESLMYAKNGGYPLPGFVYTFIYPPQKGDEVNVQVGRKTEQYIDYVPLIFCMSINKNTIKGINLNTLPNLERVKFFELYYKAYKQFFKNIEEQTENDILALNKKFISIMSSIGGRAVLPIMNKVAGANFSYGYRSYNIRRIKQLRMVEYTEWDYIPFYEPRDAFKLMNQKEIHDLYWKTK